GCDNGRRRAAPSDEFRRRSRSVPMPINTREDNDMTATYTFDGFCPLDGYGSYGPGGDWGGYWGKQGPELLDHRLSLYGGEHRMVFGATTYRRVAELVVESTGG